MRDDLYRFDRMALNVSFEAHKEQKDKGGMPYVYHPFRVASKMDDEFSTCVALLHDVVEDTSTTIADLRAMGFPRAVTEALALMTHDKTVPYMDYVLKIKTNEIATKVKLADLADNSDLSRLESVTEADLERVKKYQKARELLLS